MNHVPANSLVAQRVAARHSATPVVVPHVPAEEKKLKPAVPMWALIMLFLVSLYGLIMLANAFPVIYVIFGVSVAIYRYAKGYRFRDLFTTPQRKD